MCFTLDKKCTIYAKKLRSWTAQWRHL